MFGYTAPEIVGTSVERLFPVERGDELPLLLERLEGGERISHYATVTVRQDGTPIDVSLTLSPLVDERGEIVGTSAIARDVTERKRLGEQLRQTQRLESVARLAAGVASEFGKVVEAIDDHAQRLAERLGGDDAAREDAEDIRRTADRAAALTRQLLAFGARQPAKHRVLDPKELLASCEPMLRATLGDAVDLVVAPAPATGRVDADPAQLEQALRALAENAREAMPRGGTLTLETTNVDLTEEVAREHFRLLPGAYVLLTVRDTGDGMDDATRLRIFEPFFTTKDDGRGRHGLGLSQVYGTVEQAGGTIGVQSSPGSGTAFRIYLPRVEHPAEPLAGPTPEQLRGDETVLIVEDDPAVRSLAERILREHGYTVLTAEGAERGLEICAGLAGPLDVLVTDVVMPRVGGRELAERLATLRPEAAVVYTTAFADALADQGGRQPGTTIVEKPFTAEALARAVRSAIDARSAAHVAEAIARRQAA
jgi:PAS domain S-box-containing protein